ncbi:MAG: anti-sigma factor [Burkholderiales bacterium]|nr:anti-sigma factor [Burkholderiales bacterium]
MTQYRDEDLQAYVDAELSPSRRGEIQAQLAQHPEDADRVRLYAKLNEGLKKLYESVLDEPIPPRLLVRPRVWSRRIAAAGMAAGLLAAGAGLGWFGRGLQSVPATALTLPRQAAIAHVVFTPEVRHPVEVGASDEDHLVRWLSKKLGTQLKCPKLGEFSYELVGGRLLSGPNGPVAHFMYQDKRGSRLTLYVSSRRGESRETAFRFSQEDRVSVFYWIDGNFGYAISGEIAREPLLKIANAVYQQLNP